MPDIQEVRQLLSEAFSPCGIKPSHLPEIDLYIDQILTIFEDKLAHSRRSDKEKILTKSMVNNYSKERLLTPIKGKTYSREQVLELLTIVQLKNTLPIADIKNILDNLRTEGLDKEALTAVLEGENPVLTSQLADSSLESLLPQDRKDALTQEDLLGLLLEMAHLSCLYKKACETVVERYFPPAVPETKKRGEKKLEQQL